MNNVIIFDMDGLMFDTESYWREFGIGIADSLGYNLTIDFINKITGTNYNNICKCLREEYKDFPVEYFYKLLRKEIAFDMDNNGIRVKKGLYELLDYLINNNYKIGIASSTKKEIIFKYLDYAKIDKNIFDVIVSGVDFKNSKPSPDIYIKACELLETLPNNVIVLEDSGNGIISAYQAGCNVIWIPDVVIVDDNVQNLVNIKLSSLLDVIDYLETKK